MIIGVYSFDLVSLYSSEWFSVSIILYLEPMSKSYSSLLLYNFSSRLIIKVREVINEIL